MTRSPTARVVAAYRRIDDVDRPEIWITLRDRADVLADAGAVERRLAAGERLPLAGMLIAVKDNIDVAGLPTTAGCPEFAYLPTTNAVAVERLCRAGALVLGKTNMDQFGTGLLGTRSPYDAVRNSRDPELIAGGSSSGSAVAVALGIADVGIGTDTAGSVRVPAALNGVVGIKPTLGLIPTHGVVPASASFDAVSVLAADLTLATASTRVMAGPDRRDPRCRTWPADVRLAAPDAPSVAVPEPANLTALSDAYRRAFERSVAVAVDAGMRVEPVDIAVLLDAARLLYDGAFVAERYDAVGDFLDSAPAGADPAVTSIITAARAITGAQFAADLTALAHARADAAELFARFDAMLLPTTTEHPTLADVRAEPYSINRRMGTYTNFCNPLDLCAVAVPGAPTTAGAPFGVTVVAPAFHDQVALDVAARLAGTPAEPLADLGCATAVFGAGQATHRLLERLGARSAGPAECEGRRGGELFRISDAGLGRLLAAVAGRVTVSRVELNDGGTAVGLIEDGLTPPSVTPA